MIQQWIVKSGGISVAASSPGRRGADDHHADIGTNRHSDHVFRDDAPGAYASVKTFGHDVDQAVVDNDLCFDVGRFWQEAFMRGTQSSRRAHLR